MFLMMLCLPTLLMAQANTNTTTNVPPYKQYGIITPAPLTLYDGHTFSKNDLPRNRAVLVFVFSVECDHCAHMTEDILKNIEKFKDVTILMITPFKLERMKPWYDEHKIGNYKNIIMAAEPTRQIMSYYDLYNFPGAYIYDKKHKLVANYEGSVKLETILQHFK